MTSPVTCSVCSRFDGAVVVRNAFDRVARDPGPPPAHITSALISYRLHRNALGIMHMTTSLPNDPIDPDYR